MALDENFYRYFPEEANYSIVTSGRRHAFSAGNYWVYNLLFIHLHSNRNGGAMCFERDGCIKILIEDTAFTDCRSLNNSMGGAMYFETNPAFGFYMNRVCGVDCYSDNSGYYQFFYIRDINGKTTSINVSQVSISSIVPPTPARTVFAVSTFCCNIDYMNSSMNNIAQLSAGLFFIMKNCSLRFNIYADCYSSENFVFQIYEVKLCEMAHTMFSNLTHGFKDYDLAPIHFFNTVLTMASCCIIQAPQNKGENVFSLYNAYLTAIDSYISSLQYKNNDGGVNFGFNLTALDFKISIYNNVQCSLVPKPTPSSPPQKRWQDSFILYIGLPVLIVALIATMLFALRRNQKARQLEESFILTLRINADFG